MDFKNRDREFYENLPEPDQKLARSVAASLTQTENTAEEIENWCQKFLRNAPRSGETGAPSYYKSDEEAYLTGRALILGSYMWFLKLCCKTSTTS